MHATQIGTNVPRTIGWSISSGQGGEIVGSISRKYYVFPPSFNVINFVLGKNTYTI